MNAALAGLIGAVIGSLAAIGATFVTSLLQARQEHLKWLRDRKVEAYSSSLRYIQRIINMFQYPKFINENEGKDFLDNLSEVQIWLAALTAYCSPRQRKQITVVFDKLKEEISTTVESFEPKKEVHIKLISEATLHDKIRKYRDAFDIISSCERNDLSGE
jgi:hypothetical protein